MSRLYLGIDTSNYRTSAAIFDCDSGTYQNSGRILDVPSGKLGLRQSEALFQHTVYLHKQIADFTAGIGREIQAICVSTRPRAVEGSYMPCFLAGENVARSTAHLLGVPLYTASHQQGHLVAAAHGAKQDTLLGKEFLAWHLSGGTTELLHVVPDCSDLPHAEIIGGTTDISAGQLIDRAGVLLGLEFPSGAGLERLASSVEKQKPFHVKVNESYFSLSGMQNKIEKMHADGSCPAEIASFAIETVSWTVQKATEQALKRYHCPVLCAGGVMSNASIQREMSARFGAYFACPELSGDNAVGVAMIAAQQNGECLWQVPEFIPSHN